ncbi:ABC transporter ATP-binding protein [Aquabacter sp. CN5-332]|uniref:ABC transporter ATP-binding protein n=1 Tax=Aquabacter sp. CN5-332 TaxID=3156608 RepID=UPI0032B4AAF4
MTSAPLLKLDDVEVVYQGNLLALRGISFDLAERGITALLGANGAGKSTTLKTISRLLAAEGGAVRRGSLHLRGADISRLTAADLVRRGVVHVLEGRRLFRHLTVEENLRMGAFSRSDTAAVRADLEAAFTLFPRLRERRGMKAGYLSGGEQQMAAIARGFMARPSLMLIDEPTMGLAPGIAQEVFAAIRDINATERVAFLIAEQNTALALSVADRVHVLESGKLALSRKVADLCSQEEIQALYLGRALQ